MKLSQIISDIKSKESKELRKRLAYQSKEHTEDINISFIS